MRHLFFAAVAAFISLSLVSCKDDNAEPTPAKPAIDKTIVVVLPMENGLSDHWKRTFTLLEHNIDQAFSQQDETVKLKIEYHDESSDNLEELAEKISVREDVYAVIGGLYSSTARTLASTLCRTGVTFMTLATTEELVRAFASTGNLWAMTETDITQSEVLLSKVVNYGGKSVALIAKDDQYGKTFIDWFGFQSSELGLTDKGSFIYNATNLEDASLQAMQSGADYVICIPSEIEDMKPMIEAHDKYAGQGNSAPRLLFSDTAFGADVLKIHGSLVEGIEGVAFGADPETGFDVSYRTFFNDNTTLGESQLYDAAMLLTYAAWYQKLHPESSLRDALRAIVDGRDFNMGSWMGEDMRNVVNALAKGDAPYVRGASGRLNFDSKVYTNVLSTVYYNFQVYDGHYIILDYNTADGGNRTDATLAGWNWKATHMQEFGGGASIQYAPLTRHQALLIASSSGWGNYRHQADVLAMYQLLKKHGYSDEDIILIVEDDIADNDHNPEKGVIRIRQGGENVYVNVKIDYHLSDIDSEDFCNILVGNETSDTPVVLKGNEETNIFIFWSGHGNPGALCWNERANGINRERLLSALTELYNRKGYRKLAMFIEACYSGSIFDGYEYFPGMIFYTAANPYETSKADMFNTDLGVWMSNRFTSTLLENLTNKSTISMRDLYNRLFINTVGSHVMIYNSENYGNLYNSSMDEFINP